MKKNYTMSLPEELMRELKHFCIDNNAKINEIIQKAVEDYIQRKKEKQTL